MLLLCAQDEMKLMREDHEKELHELKVDNSVSFETILIISKLKNLYLHLI